MNMIYGVKDRPKFLQTVVFAIQQLLAIMAATLVVPVIINDNTGSEMQSAAALLGAGMGTLVYLLFTKFKSPVFLGSSFAFIGPMTAAMGGGLAMGCGYVGLIIGAVFAGLVYVVIALLVKLVGVGWLNKLMPAAVIGATVAIIGLSLAGNAVGDLQKTNKVTTFDPEDFQIVAIDKQDYTEDKEHGMIKLEADASSATYIVVEKDVNVNEPIPTDKVRNDISVTFKDGKPQLTANYGSVYVAILCGLITLIVTTICSTYGKKFAKLIPFIIGILAGYGAASIFAIIGTLTNNPALVIIDYSPIVALFSEGVKVTSFFNLPEFTFVKAFGEFKNLTPAYIATVAVAYLPVALVVFAEHVADHKNISSIIGTDLLENPGLSRTLLGDGVGSMAGAFFGGCPNTTYGESVACVAISRNASVITTLFTAFGAILIAFFSPFVAFVNSIPSCVMGGVCMALYGFIAVSGLKMLQNTDLNKNRNLFTVSAILIAGIGGLSLSFGAIQITTIAVALILGIIVNRILAKEKDEVAE